MKKSPSLEYRIRLGIIKRCYQKNHRSYKYYGGKGVSVCDRWLESFNNFIEDMGPCPSEKHTIDRIDSNGNYTKENCKWSTMEEQSKNKSNNIYIEHGGEKLILKDFAKRVGLVYGSVLLHYHQGWTIEQILSAPTRRKKIKNQATECCLAENKY